MSEPIKLQTYIRLESPEELDKNVIKEWFKTVKNNLPSGLMDSFQQVNETGKPENVRLVASKLKNKHFYDIPLTRNLTEDEAQIIVDHWDNQDLVQDFIIQTSTPVVNPMYQQFPQVEYNIKDEDFGTLCELLSKEEHNRWVEDQVSDGWRLGNSYSEQNKTHPLLKPWEQLPEQYKYIDDKMPQRFIEALERMGYVIIDKNSHQKLVDSRSLR